MILNNYQSFKESKSDKWIYEGDFKVTSGMIKSGSLIKDMIPDEVTGSFYCSYNQLTSLEGCPSKVGGGFYCYNNQLTNLEGCPSSVGGGFNCYNNKLTSLQHCPSKVGGDFYCSNNQLTSLQHCPSTVGGDFYCYYNQLTSLQHCPSKVGGDFYCYNNKLTSLQHCPSTVGGSFYCSNNMLDLTIEQEFIKSGACSSQENYFIDLLKYMINAKIDLDKIRTWPKGFLSQEVIDSAKGIKKFNL